MRWVRLAIPVTLLVTSASASASPSARLVYSRVVGAEECPDEAALRRAVVARVGYDPFFPWASTTVIVRLDRAKSGEFTSTVDLVDGEGVAHGSRVLDGRSCAALLDATALAVSIAIDPRALLGPVESPEPSVASSGPPKPETAEPVTPPASPPPPERAPAEADVQPAPRPPGPPPIEAWLGARAAFGTAPAAALGGAVGVAFVTRRVGLGAEGRIDGPASVPGPAGGRARAWAARAALLPCARLGAFRACGAFEVGSLHAEGVDVEGGRAGSTLWLALGARGAVEVPLAGGFALRPSVDVLVPLRHVTLRVNGAEAWQTPSVALGGGIDLVAHFP